MEKCGREIIKIYPDRAAGYTFVSAALTAQQRWQDLDALLPAAEKAVPDNLMPYFIAARTIINDGGEMTRAERYVRKYLTQEPEPNATKTSRAHWRLAQTLEKQGHKSATWLKNSLFMGI